MALQFSVSARNARLDAVEVATGASAQLRLYSGTQPADCATAPSGSLLATLTLPTDWMANAASGSKALAGTWSGTASGAGTAGYFRIYDSGGTTCHAQGSVGTTGTDMILAPSAALTASQPISITSFTLTDANA